MMRADRFMPGDLTLIDVQPSQRAIIDAEPDLLRHAVALAASGPCWTLFDGHGRILMVGGFIVHHANHATAWSVISRDKGHDMVAITRFCRARIRDGGWRRCDMWIDPHDPSAIRFAMMLGLEREVGPVRSMTPMGGDMDLYARIKGVNQ